MTRRSACLVDVWVGSVFNVEHFRCFCGWNDDDVVRSDNGHAVTHQCTLLSCLLSRSGTTAAAAAAAARTDAALRTRGAAMHVTCNRACWKHASLDTVSGITCSKSLNRAIFIALACRVHAMLHFYQSVQRWHCVRMIAHNYHQTTISQNTAIQFNE